MRIFLLLLICTTITSFSWSTGAQRAWSTDCPNESVQCVPANATKARRAVRCDATRLLLAESTHAMNATLDSPLPHPLWFTSNKSAVGNLVFAMRKEPRPLQFLIDAGKRPAGKFYYLNLGARGVGDATTEHMARGKFGVPASTWTQHAFDADGRMGKAWKEKRPDVHFHHNAIWVRDETLHFGYARRDPCMHLACIIHM